MRFRKMKYLTWSMLAALVFLSGFTTGGIAAKQTVTSNSPRTLTVDYFGIHFHRLQLIAGEKAIPTVWPPLQFGMVRLWDSRTRWADVEPTPNVWNFSKMDFYVAEAQKRNVKILYTLGSTPAWASKRPTEPCSYGKGCAAEPADLEDWRAYVRKVAQRYRGKICCYELWNEPKFSDIKRDRNLKSFYSGSVATLVDMARIARQVLNEEDPKAMLLTPGFVNGTDRLDMFLAAGGRQYVQAVAYHFYAWNDEQRMLKEIGAVRAVMQKNGVADLPLWSTEAGVEVFEPSHPLPAGIKSRITREEAAAQLVRQIVLSAFSGLDKYFYYAWDNDKSGMVDRAGQPRPARDAMLQAQRWLIGARLDRCEIQDAQPTVCWGEKDAKPFAIVWNPDSRDARDMPLPRGLRVTGQQQAVTGWAIATKASSNGGSLVATPNPTFYSLERVPTP